MSSGENPACEAELVRAYRLLEEVEEISRTGGWEFEVATGRVAWTAGVYRVYGVGQDFNPNDLERCIGFYSPDDAPAVDEAFRKAVGTGEPYDLEVRLVRGDCRTIWVRTVGRATMLDGKVVRVSGNIIDIDDLKRTQLEAARLNAELEHRVADRTARLERTIKDLETFSHAISHDLKAPLRAIAGFSRMVAEDYSDVIDAEGKRKLAVVSSSATTLDTLLTEILKLARIGTADIDRSRVDMKAMAVAMYHEVASGDELESVTLDIGDLPDCAGDSSMLRKVWGALLDNALKFTAGRKDRTITVYAERSDCETTYFIRDNGAGFDPRYKDRLFVAFQRLHPHDEYRGTGTGLALVRRIVDLHGGSTGADGEEGKGAVFWFSLPCRPDAGNGDA